MKKITLKTLGLILACITLNANISFAQLKIAPVIYNISEGNEYVLVIKANEKFETPERVVMNDFNPSEEAFSPFELETYPRWDFKNITINQQNGTSIHHIALHNIDTDMYYHRSGNMKTKEEYEKTMERDESGHIKSKYEDYINFYFIPERREGNFIWLRIPNNEGKSLVVTNLKWKTRDFKIVLVKYK
jgi:hypothetical protein